MVRGPRAAVGPRDQDGDGGVGELEGGDRGGGGDDHDLERQDRGLGVRHRHGRGGLEGRHGDPGARAQRVRQGGGGARGDRGHVEARHWHLGAGDGEGRCGHVADAQHQQLGRRLEGHGAGLSLELGGRLEVVGLCPDAAAGKGGRGGSGGGRGVGGAGGGCLRGAQRRHLGGLGGPHGQGGGAVGRLAQEGDHGPSQLPDAEAELGGRAQVREQGLERGEEGLVRERRGQVHLGGRPRDDQRGAQV
mmetsp:Transcript_50352/g.139666  ORF Transcript_50352/g.139666 Transcript_50352/m.139666 type:complete len:247 (-) Transcript_50352:80-820(-)